MRELSYSVLLTMFLTYSIKLISVFLRHYTSSPTSIWEAMAAGKPIVTTDVGSVSTYIKDGESGFIVPVNDHDQLFEKTVKLINDKSLRVKFGNNAREIAHKSLNISSAASKHANIYSEEYLNKINMCGIIGIASSNAKISRVGRAL